LSKPKLLFYDFEVLSNCKDELTGRSYWLVVIIDYETRKGKIIKNDEEELANFFNKTKEHIYVGFNSRQYDQYIFKGLLLGMDAGYINNQLIENGKKGHEVVKQGYKIPFRNFDIMPNPPVSLKTLEGFMGSNIKESSIPFDIDRPLTAEEEKELTLYCIHDVKETIKVFEKRKSEFESHLGLIEMFDLGMEYFNKTKAQLTAAILEAKRFNNPNDEFDFIYPTPLRLEKYKHVKEWFDKLDSEKDEKGKKNELITDIAGMKASYLLGGVHAALPNYQDEGILISADVASLYPALIINYNLMSRSVENVDKFTEIRDTRLKYKKEKNPLQAPLKIAINSVYGCFGDQFNPLCDYRMMRSVCVAGQLLLTDLVEKIEDYCTPFNLNTDGVFFKVKDEDTLLKIKEIAKEWEQRTGLELEWERYVKVVQKDVNNYIIVDEKGKYKGKGAYVKDLSDLDYDLPIVNKALVNYFVHNTPIEETINQCNELREFQKIVKLKSPYKTTYRNCTFSKQKVLDEKTGKTKTVNMWNEDGELLLDKTFRVFASTREEDGAIYKKKDDKNPEKFANTPEKAFINNEDIKGVKIPDYLDKQYYIDLAQERINQYLGVKKKKSTKKKKEVS
jgi:DNA polymerase elongation subunit (family B)